MKMNFSLTSLSAGFAAVVLTVFLGSCSAPVNLQTPLMGYNQPKSGLAKPSTTQTNRPGLATTLGDEVYDSSRSTQFYRKSANQPDAIASFHYNDEAGAKAMAELIGGSVSRRSGKINFAGGKIKAALEQRYGRVTLPSYQAGNKTIFVGQPGERYIISLSNPTKKRQEVVVSVDGLDVLSAQPASFGKRGYVVEPHSSITINGMMIKGKLRSLEFGAVGESQAAKSGAARNVGVIGLAIFEEDELAAKAAQLQENLIRDDASAFPRG
jgi:hypothetical protein